MSISQALSAALAGVEVTQKGLAVIAGNVANVNTPGYVDQSLGQAELVSSGMPGVSVNSDGINRNLNTLVQSQLWTETSGGSYADMASSLYQQLQNIYGTPGSSTSFDAIFNNFTSSLQTLSTSPSSYSAQAGVVSSAQVLAQNLNAMTTNIQQLRTQSEDGIATDVQTANTALQQIANINQQLQGAPADGATAALEDQRDQAITQLTQMLNVNVVTNPNNQISVYTGTGQQLVSGVQASTLSFSGGGTLSANDLWSANPSQDGVGTITLTSPSGTQTDLIADGATQSGEIGAYVKMRDTILPQAQNQLDEMANEMSQALSNQTTSGTAVTVGSQSGYSIDTSALSAGNTMQLTYTDSGNVQHTITIEALGAGGSLPLQTDPTNSNNSIIGVNFAGGMSGVVSALNTAFGGNVQFSNPSGTVLQAVNASATTNVVNALSATTTATSLTGGSAQLPMFLDGSVPISGALTSNGSQTTGLAGRITVNTALVSSPGSLVAYAAGTAAGDSTRPNFILSQMTSASLTFSPTTGIGSAQQPYSGTLSNYMTAVVDQQTQASTAASNLQQGQDTVVSALQQRFNDTAGVNIDTELSNLIALQNAYGANARVMSTIAQMMQTLLQVGT